MKSQNTDSFDEVIRSYYGRGPARLTMEERTRALLADYYGKPPLRTPPPDREKPATAVALSCDDGEVMAQRPHARHRLEEYVLEASIEPTATTSPSSVTAAATADDLQARDEWVFDVLGKSGDTPPSAPTRTPPSATTPTEPERPKAVAPEASRSSQPDAAPGSESRSTDDAFIEDMKAILSGQMVYDPRSKATVDPKQLEEPSSGPRGKAADPTPAAPTGDAIFERIARSMQYANAYDLGTVELENRFAEFDKLDEEQRKAADEKRARPATTPLPVRKDPIGAAEFIQDLAVIQSLQPSGPMPLVVPVPTVPAQAASSWPSSRVVGTSDAVSRPLYDTGEHVLFGGNFYPDQLRVGVLPGLPFSYGQVIAMADLFESPGQMMATDLGQLARIKTLIERSTAYYAGNRADPAKDVSDDEWDSVTGGRYLTLAEMNFEHFSPNFLFRNATFAAAANRHGNNRSAWETYHRQAIKEAQQIGLTPPVAASPMLPLEGPLITNAFGDHFLTDAFSAGHLINKDAVGEYWKTQFLDGSGLKPDAKTFFEKLAEKAFTLGHVKARFSKLETVDRHYGFHPNIDSASRFASVLSGIAEQQPDRMANLVIKAIHDRLNVDGVEVYNDASDGTWHLTGDGTLNAKNRAIVQRAVEASIGNINDPGIMVSNLDFDALFARVWKHVPKLTPATEQKLRRIVRDYVSTDSNVLVDAAARIIERKLDLFINELIKAKALRPA